MKGSIIASFLFSPILLSLGAPTVERAERAERHEIMNIDWEKELLGRSSLDARAGEASIDAIFKKLGKQYFGTCADSGTLGRADNAAIIKNDFGQVTPENR